MTLRDRLIDAEICIDCQLEMADQHVRCAACHEKHNRKTRRLYHSRKGRRNYAGQAAGGMRLQDRLIEAKICIDCKTGKAEHWVRCLSCHEKHKQLQRDRYRQQSRPDYQASHPTSKRNVMSKHKLTSYTTAKERGLIK